MMVFVAGTQYVSRGLAIECVSFTEIYMRSAWIKELQII